MEEEREKILELVIMLWLTDPHVRAMTPAQRGHYIDLLCYMGIEDDANIEANDEKIMEKLKCPEEDWKVLRKRLIEKEGRYYQKKLKRDHDKKKKKKSKRDEEKKTPQDIKIHGECIKIYKDFYKKQSKELKPKFTNTDAKAIWELVKHFRTVKEGNTDEDVKRAFELIFDNWKSLTPYLQSSVNPTFILSKINDIQIRIKSIKPASRPKQYNLSGL